MIWQDIDPADATEIDCRERPDLRPPLNEAGELCPWPWEPQQLAGLSLGMYHCNYCGGMAVAGLPHPDYRPVLAAEQLISVIGGEEPDLDFALRMVQLAKYIADSGRPVPVATATANGRDVSVRYTEGEWIVL